MALVAITVALGQTLWLSSGPVTAGQTIYVPYAAAAQATSAGLATYPSSSQPPPSSGGSPASGTGTGSITIPGLGWTYADLVAGTNGAPPIPSTGYVTAFCRDARVLGQGPGRGRGTMVIGSGGDWLMLSGSAVLV